MAANPLKGEIDLPIAGRNYVFCFSTNACVALENVLDRGIFDVTEELRSWLPPAGTDGKPLRESVEQVKARNARVRIGFCRSVFWAGFQDHHPDMTVIEAGELMKAAGGMIAAVGLIAQGMSLAFPDAKPEAAAKAHPRKRAAR